MSKSHQNWNSLFRYIKSKLGSPINLLELSDKDIYDIVVEDVLPPLSQYIGQPLWIRLDKSNLKANTVEGETLLTAERYIIPVPDDYVIVDVQEVYWNNVGIGGSDLEMGSTVGYGMSNPMDTAMASYYNDIVKSMEVVPTFQYIPPKELLIDVSLRSKSIIIECKAEHSDLSTIPSDFYYEFVRESALAHVYEAVANIRKKYKQLNTPFGQIELNWEDLETKADRINQTIQEKLDALPPDRLIEFI